MSRKIYEQILRNSGEGFLKVNAQKDENGNYIDFDIVDYNKSFVDILKKMLKKNNLDIDILKDIIKDKFKVIYYSEIYDFFRNNIFFAILNNIKEITIDYSEIENEEFYSEDSFEKLLNLINELLEQSNDSISDCSNT